jgi:hypothetical protein
MLSVMNKGRIGSPSSPAIRSTLSSTWAIFFMMRFCRSLDRQSGTDLFQASGSLGTGWVKLLAYLRHCRLRLEQYIGLGNLDGRSRYYPP